MNNGSSAGAKSCCSCKHYKSRSKFSFMLMHEWGGSYIGHRDGPLMQRDSGRIETRMHQPVQLGARQRKAIVLQRK